MPCRTGSSRRFAISAASAPTPRSGRGCSRSSPTRPATAGDPGAPQPTRPPGPRSARSCRAWPPTTLAVRARTTPTLARRRRPPPRPLPRGRRAALLRGTERERDRRGAVVPGRNREVAAVARARPAARPARRGGDAVIDLEAALVDLGRSPRSSRRATTSWTRCCVAVSDTGRLRADRGRRRYRTRRCVAVAAVILLIVARCVAIAPARHAVADWLGIGAVEIRHSDHPLPTGSRPGTVPGAPERRAPPPRSRTELAAARRRSAFTIATPRAASAGALARRRGRPPGSGRSRRAPLPAVHARRDRDLRSAGATDRQVRRPAAARRAGDRRGRRACGSQARTRSAISTGPATSRPTPCAVRARCCCGSRRRRHLPDRRTVRRRPTRGGSPGPPLD